MHSFSSSARFQTRLRHDVDEQLPTPSTSSQCPSPSTDESEPSSSALQKALPSEMLGEVLYLSRFLPPKGEGTSTNMATYIRVRNPINNKVKLINLTGNILTLSSLERAYPGAHGLTYADTMGARNVASGFDGTQTYFTAPPDADGWQNKTYVAEGCKLEQATPDLDDGVPEWSSSFNKYLFFRKRVHIDAKGNTATTLSNVIGISPTLAITHGHEDNSKLKEGETVEVFTSSDERKISATVRKLKPPLEGEEPIDLVIFQAKKGHQFLDDENTLGFAHTVFNHQKYFVLSYRGCDYNRDKEIRTFEGLVESSDLSRRGLFRGSSGQWFGDSGAPCFGKKSRRLLGMAVGFDNGTQTRVPVPYGQESVFGASQRTIILGWHKIAEEIDKLKIPGVGFCPSEPTYSRTG